MAHNWLCFRAQPWLFTQVKVPGERNRSVSKNNFVQTSPPLPCVVERPTPLLRCCWPPLLTGQLCGSLLSDGKAAQLLQRGRWEEKKMNSQQEDEAKQLEMKKNGATKKKVELEQ